MDGKKGRDESKASEEKELEMGIMMVRMEQGK